VAAAAAAALRGSGSGPLLAIHISARKPAALASGATRLMRELQPRATAPASCSCGRPADEDNPLHPGDDRRRGRSSPAPEGLPLLAYPTHTLRELVAACRFRHGSLQRRWRHASAAGLGKPIVASSAAACASLASLGRTLRRAAPQSRDVSDVTVERSGGGVRVAEHALTWCGATRCENRLRRDRSRQPTLTSASLCRIAVPPVYQQRVRRMPAQRAVRRCPSTG